VRAVRTFDYDYFRLCSGTTRLLLCMSRFTNIKGIRDSIWNRNLPYIGLWKQGERRGQQVVAVKAEALSAQEAWSSGTRSWAVKRHKTRKTIWRAVCLNWARTVPRRGGGSNVSHLLNQLWITLSNSTESVIVSQSFLHSVESVHGKGRGNKIDRTNQNRSVRSELGGTGLRLLGEREDREGGVSWQ